MKTALGIFGCFFLIFAILGYRSARSAQESEEYLKLFVGSRSQLFDTKEGLLLAYKPGADIHWTFNLRSGEAKFADPSAPLSSELDKQQPAFRISDEVVASLLGSGAGVWTIKDMIKALQDQDKGKGGWRVLAAIIGGATGFSVGYWIGDAREPEHMSKNVTRLLSNPDAFRDLKRYAFLFMYRQRKEEILDWRIKQIESGNTIDVKKFVWADESLIFTREHFSNPLHEATEGDFRVFLLDYGKSEAAAR